MWWWGGAAEAQLQSTPYDPAEMGWQPECPDFPGRGKQPLVAQGFVARPELNPPDIPPPALAWKPSFDDFARARAPLAVAILTAFWFGPIEPPAGFNPANLERPTFPDRLDAPQRTPPSGAVQPVTVIPPLPSSWQPTYPARLTPAARTALSGQVGPVRIIPPLLSWAPTYPTQIAPRAPLTAEGRSTGPTTIIPALLSWSSTFPPRAAQPLTAIALASSGTFAPLGVFDPATFPQLQLTNPLRLSSTEWLFGIYASALAPIAPTPPPQIFSSGGSGGGGGVRRYRRVRAEEHFHRKPHIDVSGARKALRQLAGLLHPDRTIDLDPAIREKYTQILAEATDAFHRILDEAQHGAVHFKEPAEFEALKSAVSELEGHFAELHQAMRDLSAQQQVQLGAAVDQITALHQKFLAEQTNRWSWALVAGIAMTLAVCGLGIYLFIQSQKDD